MEREKQRQLTGFTWVAAVLSRSQYPLYFPPTSNEVLEEGDHCWLASLAGALTETRMEHCTVLLIFINRVELDLLKYTW